MNSVQQPGTSGMIRLNRFLAQCGIGSRRTCDDLIASGHVSCNGRPVRTLGMKIDPAIDRIEYRGKTVRKLVVLEYLAYFKPREVMVTARDPQERLTIYEAVEKSWRNIDHLRYVGRLDFQSEGLLILTNDGNLIHALTHPRYKIKKCYHVKVARRLHDMERERLLDGVVSEGQRLTAGAIRELSVPGEGRKQFWYEIDLYEGKNRQIRRMFEALDLRVGRLRRVQFGAVRLGGLAPGELRPLSEREVSGLRAAGSRKGRKNLSRE